MPVTGIISENVDSTVVSPAYEKYYIKSAFSSLGRKNNFLTFDFHGYDCKTVVRRNDLLRTFQNIAAV
jgi:hypothetical protein